MKIAITKRKPAINWYMLILAIAIISNALTQITLMIFFGIDIKNIMGLAISVMGTVLYGFHFIMEGKSIFYYKKYKTYLKVKELQKSNENEELSSVFVTEEGTLLH